MLQLWTTHSLNSEIIQTGPVEGSGRWWYTACREQDVGWRNGVACGFKQLQGSIGFEVFENHDFQYFYWHHVWSGMVAIVCPKQFVIKVSGSLKPNHSSIDWKRSPCRPGRFTLSKEMTNRWTFLYTLKVKKKQSGWSLGRCKGFPTMPRSKVWPVDFLGIYGQSKTITCQKCQDKKVS